MISHEFLGQMKFGGKRCKTDWVFLVNYYASVLSSWKLVLFCWCTYLKKKLFLPISFKSLILVSVIEEIILLRVQTRDVYPNPDILSALIHTILYSLYNCWSNGFHNSDVSKRINTPYMSQTFYLQFQHNKDFFFSQRTVFKNTFESWSSAINR